jgi:light-regulated signal transduction histidine kinase (bacteriophytochrome)
MAHIILVVDDDDVIRMQLRESLEQIGYWVAEAEDSQQAIAVYKQRQPDLVLLDALMPGMDEIICCTQLVTFPASTSTPVIIMTDLDDQASLAQAFAAGAADYISKPIQWQVLYHRVCRLVKARSAIEELRQQTEQAKRQNLRSKLFADVTLKIRQSLQIDEILQISVTEVKKLLQADRVLIFRLNTDGSGIAVKEANTPGLPIFLGQHIHDSCFVRDYIPQYLQGRISAINDIELADIQPCHAEFLRNFCVKANLVVPIIHTQQLWGLLIAHQCYHTRDWTSWEIELLRQLADQIGIGLAQARMLEQETRQREELARSNEELQQFAFIASHDLQEPLRKIKTFSDRVQATCGNILPAQAQDYLQRMQNAVHRMQALIEDLLRLSRVTTRAQPFEQVNLTQVTQEVLSDLEVLVQQTRGCVEVGHLPTIKADPLQMRQLLQNLIGNALKFHQPQTPPIVKIYSQTTMTQAGVEFCQIIVEDNGIGFDEKYIERIFSVFQRLHGRNEYEGTGIGLAICRKIAERHHGSITAKSKLGQGASFIVTLPMDSFS